MRSLIVHCCHHKTGTAWFTVILRRIADELDLDIHVGEQKDLPDHADIFLENHSKVTLDKLPDHRGTHMIRDPRDVVVSSYYYHLYSSEPWLHIPRPHFEGKTYQETLSRLGTADGLKFEIDHATGRNIDDMTAWNYNRDSFLELKYENVISDYDASFERIFRHYGFKGADLSRCIDIARSRSFDRVTGRSIGTVHDGQHTRCGAWGQWRREFTADVKNHFKRRCGQSVLVLGYECSEDW